LCFCWVVAIAFEWGSPRPQGCDACVARHGLRLLAFARGRGAGAARALALKKTQIWLVSYELLA